MYVIFVIKLNFLYMHPIHSFTCLPSTNKKYSVTKIKKNTQKLKRFFFLFTEKNHHQEKLYQNN